MTSEVLVERRGGVGWITINRPERRNALNDQVAAGIVAALDGLEADASCRAVVLTGAGEQAFCAGGDLKADESGAPFTVDPADPRNFVIALFRRLDACNLPVIARVNGHALAGGLGLLCACDLAVASSEARFGTPEARVGLFPMMILPALMRVLPARKLMELCITAEQFGAEEALAMGLVNYLAPPGELDEKLDWLLSRVVDKSPTAFRLGKMALRAMRDMEHGQALEYAQLMLPMMARTQDAKEGFAAFRERRAPRWTGR